MTRTVSGEMLKKRALVDLYEDRYSKGYMDEWPIEKKESARISVH